MERALRLTGLTIGAFQSVVTSNILKDFPIGMDYFFLGEEYRNAERCLQVLNAGDAEEVICIQMGWLERKDLRHVNISWHNCFSGDDQ